MSETQYTKERWHQSGGNGILVYGNDGKAVARVNLDMHAPEVETANGARIVACVNACKGISNDALTSGAVSDAIKSLCRVVNILSLWEAEDSLDSTATELHCVALLALKRLGIRCDNLGELHFGSDEEKGDAA